MATSFPSTPDSTDPTNIKGDPNGDLDYVPRGGILPQETGREEALDRLKILRRQLAHAAEQGMAKEVRPPGPGQPQ